MQMTKEQKDKMLSERGIVVYDRIKPSVSKYNTVSLFSGIGGFDLCFMYAGERGGIEWNIFRAWLSHNYCPTKVTYPQIV